MLQPGVHTFENLGYRRILNSKHRMTGPPKTVSELAVFISGSARAVRLLPGHWRPFPQ